MATQAAPDWRARAREYATKHRLDPRIFERQIDKESRFNPEAVNPESGAIGLGQLMPETARELGVDPRDPEQNLEGSARYLRQKLDEFGGDYRLALAAYNAGAGRVKEYGGIPPFAETRDYVSKIMGPRTVGSLAGRKVRTPDGKTYRIPAGATEDQITRFLATLRPADTTAAAPTQAAPAAPPAQARPAPVDTIPSHRPAAPREVMRAPEPRQIEGPEFVRGLHSGLSGSNVQALGRALKGVGVEGLGESLRQAGAREAQVPKVASFRDVRSASEFFDYIQFQLGQGLASTVPSVGGATVGGLLGFSVAGPPGAVVGATGGAAVPSYVLNFGDIEEEVEAAMPDASSLDRAQVAAVIAAPVAALDVIPAFRLGRKAAKRLAVQKVIREAAKRGLIERGLREGLKSGTAEAITEATQEAVQAVAVAQAAGKPLDPDTLVTRLVDAAIGGAVTGAALGGSTEAIPQRRGGGGVATAPSGVSVAESAAIRKNIEPPATVPAHLVRAGEEAAADLGRTVAEVQASRPMSFHVPGLDIEQAHVFPELIRIFPGDPEPVRVTVQDRITGRIHSQALPSVQALQEAIAARRREERTLEVETPPSVQVKPTTEGIEVPQRPKRGELALKGVDAPKAVEALRAQIAARPGDKRVKRWKRRLAALEAKLPKTEPAKIKAGPGNPPLKATGAVVPGGLGTSRRGAKAPPRKSNEKPPASTVEVSRRHLRDRRRTAGVGPKGVERRARARRAEDLRALRTSAAVGRQRLEEIAKAKGFNELVAVYRRHHGQDPRRGISTANLRKELTDEAQAMVKGATQTLESVKGAEESYLDRATVEATREEMFGKKPTEAQRAWIRKQGYAAPSIVPHSERTKLVRQWLQEKPGSAAPSTPAKAPPPPKAEVAAPAKITSKVQGERTFIEEFEDLARQGTPLEEATERATALSGNEPPAGLDLAARHSRIRRESQEGAGQEDIFGGAALLGAPAGSRSEADIDQPERAAPPSVSEAGSRADRPSEAKDVALEGLWYWRGFQNRDVPAGTQPTQDPAELVNAQHVRMLSEPHGGFQIDEVRRRPILVWTDQKGELGEKGRRYVIDGHHRTYMAKEAGAKKLPAVEVFGDLAYAKSQARVTNVAGVPNTYSEQARISKELLDRGDPLERVASQVRTTVSKAKRMIDFAHLDPAVRNVFFPSGQEGEILATSYGELVGKYAAQSPDVMTVNMQEKWLNKAVDEDMRPALFAKTVKEWHDIITAARQEIIDLGAKVKGTRLSMTPEQFHRTSGRLISAIDAKKREIEKLAQGLEHVAGRARAKGHEAARAFAEKQLQEVSEEGLRLMEAKKEITEAIKEALVAAMQGERDLPASFDAIQKRVDEIVGPNPPRGSLLGQDGLIQPRYGDLLRRIREARRRLRGVARRDPTVKKLVKGPPEPEGPVEKILAALDKAKPARTRQESMYTKERIERIQKAEEAEAGLRGEERFRARLRALRGKYKQVDFESIAKALNQEDVDALVEMILNHPGLEFFDKVNAGIALRKLLAEDGGQLPQRNELELLEIVYGTKFVEALSKLHPRVFDLRAIGYALANVTRTLRTSFDLSAPLRQGLYLGPSYPKEWGKAWWNMHRFWWAEKNYEEGMEEIYRDPMFKLARKAGLAITRPGSALLDAQEEAFLGSNIIGEAPRFVERVVPGVAGKAVAAPFRVGASAVRRSDRAYTGFLNKLRMDVFKNLVALAEANGHNPYTDPKLARAIAAFVNAGTGRGDSRFITNHAQALNAIFFSPRLIKSRLHLLNPKNYVTGSPFMRRQYLRSTVALAGAASMVLTLAAWAGARVEWDRLNGDWGKIRVGKTVYDVLGGFAQYLRLIPTVAEALYNQSQGKRLRYGNAAEILMRFTEHKLSPIAGFIVGLLKNRASEEDIAGPRGSFDFWKELVRAFVPMVAEDWFEVYKKDPNQIPVAVPASTYGVSVSTYPPPRGR